MNRIAALAPRRPFDAGAETSLDQLTARARSGDAVAQLQVGLRYLSATPQRPGGSAALGRAGGGSWPAGGAVCARHAVSATGRRPIRRGRCSGTRRRRCKAIARRCMRLRSPMPRGSARRRTRRRRRAGSAARQVLGMSTRSSISRCSMSAATACRKACSMRSNGMRWRRARAMPSPNRASMRCARSSAATTWRRPSMPRMRSSPCRWMPRRIRSAGRLISYFGNGRARSRSANRVP